jgi:hypothetical protein
MFVILLINVIIQIPELNIAQLFTLSNTKDPERECLTNAVNASSSYTRQIDDDESLTNNNDRISVVQTQGAQIADK